MPSPAVVAEFKAAWLPHMTDDGLGRVTELLAKASPLLIHGAFAKAVPQGCLASHVAWNHPRTRHLDHEAGVCWLSRVAGLNPATSRVVLAWDQGGVADYDLRTALLSACLEERDRRESELLELAAH
jgi:hypothetical protein